MRLGAVFPSLEIGNDPIAIRDYAQGVEALGYRHLLILEHVLGFDRPDFRSAVGGLTHASPFHEPLVLMGYLAACTRRIELVAGVLVLPLRQTALVAKQAAEVDVLSGGRLRLGVGVGWIEPEFTALNQDWHTRGARSAEQIAVLRALWTESVVTFHGRWHQIEAAGINPLPVQRPIPLWLGGSAEATLKRIARLGDGWITARPPNDEARALAGRLRAYIEAAGRATDAVGIEALLSLGKLPRAEWRGYVGDWRALGATHLSVNTMEQGYTSIQNHLDALRDARAVLEA
ncbi:MAG TPA: LLM class F420-dependent oxidoreductase [Thermomicrobiales bacterium]|nr:LLM class F420-dependent oxidoreductase [Thermomicrobiales bacterium]